MLPTLTIYDIIILLLYLGVVLCLGVYSLIRQSITTDVYFFAARKSGWLTLGASLFSAQFLMAVFFPVNGTLLAVALTVMGTVVLILVAVSVGRFILPPDDEPKRNTLEIFDRLFGRKHIHSVSTIPFIILAGVRLVATTLFCSYAFECLLGWNPGSSIIVLILFVGLLTIVGGYQAVVATQAFQMTGVFAGIVMLVFVGGGLHFQPGLWRFAAVSGGIMLAAWSLSGDHYFTQHRASARSAGDMAKGLIFTGLLNVVCIAAVLLLRTLASSGTATVDPELPAGARGIIIAGILSLVMSSLAGIFSSTAAFFTLNVFHLRDSNSSERTLVLVGRLATTGIVIAAMIAIMAGRAMGAAGFNVLQTAFGMTAAPLAAMYCWSMFSRTRAWAEISWPVVTGLVVGLLRLVLEILASQGVVMAGWPEQFLSLHYLVLSFYIFTATMLLFAGSTIPAAVVRE
jgi:solute:Na+ symporter, SSS family